MRYIVASAG